MAEIVYGRHPVHHLLTAGRRKVQCVHVQKGSEKDLAPLVALARTNGIPVKSEDLQSLAKQIKPGSHHQGVFAETESYPYIPIHELYEEPFLLILDEIQDPQNLGALCRSAYLLGVGGVVIPETQAAAVGPGATQASVGAVEYLKIARVSSIASVLEQAKKHSYWVYGADGSAEKDVSDEAFPAKVALVIGNEERGLRRLVRERCDILLRVPMKKDAVDSLNASVAGGILMYEIYRQKSCGRKT